MMAVLSMEVILGSLTFTGSLMAAGKLQEVLPQRPITYKGQNIVNLAVLAIAVVVAVILVMHPERGYLYPLIVVLPLIFGVLMIIPIGGADMPTVISLLNSYAGLSAAAMGFVLDNKLLIIAGALGRSVGIYFVGEYVEGDEPVVFECAVWSVWAGAGRRGGRSRSAAGEERERGRGGGDSCGGEQSGDRAGIWHGGVAGTA